MTGAAELLAAAAAIEGRLPRAAALLRTAATAGPPDPDPRRARRAALRRAWRRHYPDHARTVAARLIAADWAGWLAGNSRLPGDLAAEFRALDDAGFSPIAWRQIADDLDAELDPPAANPLQLACGIGRDRA